MDIMNALEKVQLTIVLGCVIHEDKLLLIRRNEPEQKQIHGFFELPGGKIEFGENPVKSIAREIMEETGNEVFVGPMLPFPFVAVRTYKDKQVNVMALCFLCTLVGEPRADVIESKTSEVKWFPLDELEPIHIQTGSLQFISHVLEQDYSHMETKHCWGRLGAPKCFKDDGPFIERDRALDHLTRILLVRKKHGYVITRKKHSSHFPFQC